MTGSAKSAPTSAEAGPASAGLLSSNQLSGLVAAAAKQKFKVAYTDGSGDTLRYAQDGSGNVMQGSDDSESFATLTTTDLVRQDRGHVPVHRGTAARSARPTARSPAS